MIAPGKTETLAMTISCNKLKGEFTRKLIVMTNDPNHSKETLLCKGRILDPMVLKPRQIVFGKISNKEGPQQVTLELTRGDGGPIKPKLGKVNRENLDLQLHEIEPGERYKLEVTMRPPFDKPTALPKLTLETGVPEAPQVDLRIRYRITPHVVAQPRNLRLPGKLEEEWVRTIRLFWDDDASHTILGATANDPAVKLEVKDNKGGQIVVVRMAAVAEVSPRSRLIRISTDDAVSPIVNVPILVGRTPRGDERPDAVQGTGFRGRKLRKLKAVDPRTLGKREAPEQPRSGKSTE